MVTPSYMLSILDEYTKLDRDPRESSWDVGIFGRSEVMGPEVANECVETKDGLHIS